MSAPKKPKIEYLDEVEELAEQRRAGMDLVRQGAREGDPICGAVIALEAGLRETPGAPWFFEDSANYADEEEGEM